VPVLTQRFLGLEPGQVQHQAGGADDNNAMNQVPVVGRQVPQAEEQRPPVPGGDQGRRASGRVLSSRTGTILRQRQEVLGLIDAQGGAVLRQAVDQRIECDQGPLAIGEVAKAPGHPPAVRSLHRRLQELRLARLAQAQHVEARQNLTQRRIQGHHRELEQGLPVEMQGFPFDAYPGSTRN